MTRIMRCYAFALATLGLLPSAASGEVSTVDTNLFLTVIEAHLAAGNLSEGDPPSIFGHFFHTGDRERFVSTVEGWLNGVVVDPEYLRATSGEGVAGFTQPSGWTGFSQSLVQSLEQRYNGYIVLARFDPDNPQDVATATHEAIHAFALALGSGLDSDEDGGPSSCRTSSSTTCSRACASSSWRTSGPCSSSPGSASTTRSSASSRTG